MQSGELTTESNMQHMLQSLLFMLLDSTIALQWLKHKDMSLENDEYVPTSPEQRAHLYIARAAMPQKVTVRP